MGGEWLCHRVKERRTGSVGKVTADLGNGDANDVLAVFFTEGELAGKWNSYTPNQWSKDNLFDLIHDDDRPL